MSDPNATRATFAAVLGKSEPLLARMGLDYEVVYRMCCHALITSQIRARGKPDMATLADATQDSIKLALITCLNAGLAPDGEEVALVPLRRGKEIEAEAWIGIVGKLKLARRATPGLAVESRTVYVGDEFEVEFGLEPKLIHRPGRGKRDDASIDAVYAIARMPGAAPEVEVWFRPDIDRYRARSRAKRGPWQTDYAEMAERGPLGALLKRLPKRAVDLVDPDASPFGDEVASASEAPAPAQAIEHQPSRPAPAAAPPADENPPVDAYGDDPFA